MNIFGSSGPSPEVVQRESIIKSQITENLKESIKLLQKAHINSDEPIYSSETANAVCNVLEAVFLHGLKASVTKKLTYLAGYETSCDVLSFWGLLQKITHKDTLLQLTQLKQINTDTGFCRAWLRLALNDGLLESYINAIINDEKTLRYYYKRTSYLRDDEHPGILITYTQSLSHFNFELAYNSSVLNIWTYTPLMLAGIVTPQSDPPPVIAREHHASLPGPSANRAVRKKTSNKSTRGLGQHTSIRSPSSDIAITGHIHRGDELIAGPVTPPNTPYDPSQLTRVDIEAIRSMTRQDGSGSSSTGTSQISHPDPVDARQLIPDLKALHIYSNSPASNIADDKSSASQLNTASMRHSTSKLKTVVSETYSKQNSSTDQGSSADCAKSTPVEHKPEQSVASISYTQPVSGTSADNSKTCVAIKTQHSYEDALNPFSEHDYDNSLNPFATDDTLESGVEHESLDSSEIPSKKESGNVASESYEKTLNPFESTSCDGQDVECVDENNPFHLESSHLTSDKESHILDHSSELALPSAHDAVSGDVTASEKEVIKTGLSSSPAQDDSGSACASSDPDLTSAEGCEDSGTEQNIYDMQSVRKGQDLESNAQSQPAPIRQNRSTQSLTKSLSQSSSFPKFDVGKSPPLEPVLSTAMATHESVELAKEAIPGLSMSLSDNISGSLEDDDDSYQPKGNSLRFMEGWSSDFEASVRSERDDVFNLSDNHGPTVNSNQESFNNMLHNYGNTINQMEIRTLSEVIDGLPDLEVGPYEERCPGLTVQKTPSSEDEVIAEYEVLPDLMEKRAYLLDPVYQPLLHLLGTITTEKGLDMQNFQCKGCSRPIGMFYGKPRVCNFDAFYYCFECHQNDEAYIPARIIYNWDFRKHKVCHQNYKFLQQCEDDPLLNIQVLNPKLYIHVPEMSEVKDLRTQLRYLKTYLFTCKQSIADAFRKQIWPREYYYEDIHLYSLYDLLQVDSGQLAKTLSVTVKFASKHVYECGLCSQKGFICEICTNPEVIYPFETSSTVKCERCSSVYHKDCRSSVSACPKCQRQMKFRQLQGNLSHMSEISEGLSDYSFPLEASTTRKTKMV